MKTGRRGIDWRTIILGVVCGVISNVVSWYFLNFAPRVMEILGIQGILIIVFIAVPIGLIIALTSWYLSRTIGSKLDNVISLLMKIAKQMNIGIGEEVRSPGYVYTTCRWLGISRELIANGVHHIYVYCSHPENPMTIYGCPSECPYLDTSDRPTGSGALAGLILGGIFGLAVAGPAGALIGGLLGAAIGNSLEVVKPVQARISELRAKGEPYVLHIDEEKLKR